MTASIGDSEIIDIHTSRTQHYAGDDPTAGTGGFRRTEGMALDISQACNAAIGARNDLSGIG